MRKHHTIESWRMAKEMVRVFSMASLICAGSAAQRVGRLPLLNQIEDLNLHDGRLLHRDIHGRDDIAVWAATFHATASDGLGTSTFIATRYATEIHSGFSTDLNFSESQQWICLSNLPNQYAETPTLAKRIDWVADLILQNVSPCKPMHRAPLGTDNDAICMAMFQANVLDGSNAAAFIFSLTANRSNPVDPSDLFSIVCLQPICFPNLIDKPVMEPWMVALFDCTHGPHPALDIAQRLAILDMDLYAVRWKQIPFLNQPDLPEEAHAFQIQVKISGKTLMHWACTSDLV